MTTSELKAKYAELNPHGHWFDKSTMKFFRTRIHGIRDRGKDGIYFVTSEINPFEIKRFTLRRMDPKTGDIKTVGQFHSMNEDQAKEALLAVK